MLGGNDEGISFYKDTKMILLSGPKNQTAWSKTQFFGKVTCFLCRKAKVLKKPEMSILGRMAGFSFCSKCMY